MKTTPREGDHVKLFRGEAEIIPEIDNLGRQVFKGPFKPGETLYCQPIYDAGYRKIKDAEKLRCSFSDSKEQTLKLRLNSLLQKTDT